MYKHINHKNDFISLLSEDEVRLFYTSIELSDSFINETYFEKGPIGSRFNCKEWSDGQTKVILKEGMSMLTPSGSCLTIQ